MTYALVSPNESAKQISAWEKVGSTYVPVYTVYGERVAEVLDTPFEVALPLFWIACGNDVVADQFYYSTSSQAVMPLPAPPPYPEQAQPQQQGAENF